MIDGAESHALELAERELQLAGRRRLLSRHIALIGFMGAGKSSLGRVLSERLDRPFVDTDSFIEVAYGRPVVDYFACGEEARFRQLESETVSELLDGPTAVLAVGGGTMDDPWTRSRLLERSFVVHLAMSWPDVRRELSALRAGRPMMRSRSEAEVHELFLRRHRAYRQAHLSIATPRGRIDVAANHVLTCLERLRRRT